MLAHCLTRYLNSKSLAQRPLFSQVTGSSLALANYLAQGPVHGQLLVQVNMGDDILAVRPEVLKLLLAHVLHSLELVIGVGRNELFDDHEATADADDELAVEDLGVDLLGTKPVLAAANLAKRHWAVGCIDVARKHLVKGITFRNIENRRFVDTLLITNAPVHDLDDLVLVLQSAFNHFDLLNLGLNGCRELVQSLNELFLVKLETIDVSIKPLNVAIQVHDLRRL